MTDDERRLAEASTQRAKTMTDDELLLAIASKARMVWCLDKVKQQFMKEARHRGIRNDSIERYASTRPDVWRQTAAIRRVTKPTNQEGT